MNSGGIQKVARPEMESIGFFIFLTRLAVVIIVHLRVFMRLSYTASIKQAIEISFQFIYHPIMVHLWVFEYYCW